MFSSSSNFNPFEYANHSSNFTSIDQNPSPTQEDQSPPFWYIPDRFLDNGDLLITEFLSQQQQEQQQQQQQQYEKQVLGSNATVGAAETQAIVNPAAGPDNAIGASTNNKKKRSNASNAPKQPPNPRRRTGKKDRHSKIHTAQGPRDRRMRLSLQIARKFFDLQDLLGFDKASKTIEWLFTKSKAAIKELTESLPRGKSSSSSACGKSPSTTSESEVVSSIVVISDTIEDKRRKEEKSDSLGSVLKEKRSKRLHKPAFSPVDRESRDKARARARQRAREKKQNKDIVEKSKQSSQPNPSNLETLGCSGTQEMNSSAKEVYEKEESTSHLLQHQMDSANKFLGITSSPRSSSVFDFVPSGVNFENEYSGFPLNWEMMTNGSVQHIYSTISNMKLSTGNLQVQNPNSFSMTLPNGLEQKTSSDFAIPSSQEQILRSMLMTTTLNSQEENPSSDFMNMSNPNMQNLNSILLATATDDNTGLHPHIIGNQFSSNPIVSADYVSFC